MPVPPVAAVVAGVVLVAGAGVGVGLATRSTGHPNRPTAARPAAGGVPVATPDTAISRAAAVTPSPTASLPVSAAATPAPPPTRRPLPTVSLRELASAGSGYRISVEYPVLAGLPASSPANAALLAAARAIASRFATDAGYATGQPGAPPQTSVLDESATVTYLSADFVSVIWTGPGHLSGGTGEDYTDAGLTLALPSGSPVGLGQLFRAGADYLPILTAAAAAQLQDARPGLDASEAAQQVAAADTFAAWSVLPGGLRVDLVNATAALDDPVLTVPAAALRSVVATDGPLARG
jgi:hypothetical protein